MTSNLLADMAGTQRDGRGELWLDPEGNEAILYDCNIDIADNAVHYTWQYKGDTKTGCFRFFEDKITWQDSWHQPDGATCQPEEDDWGIFTLHHQYSFPGSPAWGWRSKLSERPDGALVLQMTNIAPWGEEGRAVRMVFPA